MSTGAKREKGKSARRLDLFKAVPGRELLLVLPLLVGASEMYALPTKRRTKVYALRPRFTAVDIANRVEEKGSRSGGVVDA